MKHRANTDQEAIDPRRIEEGPLRMTPIDADFREKMGSMESLSILIRVHRRHPRTNLFDLSSTLTLIRVRSVFHPWLQKRKPLTMRPAEYRD
jgi:hypothetical protein